MPCFLHFRLLPHAAMACAFIAAAAPLHAEPAKPDPPGDAGPRIRMVFLSTPAKAETLILATPGKEGTWTEHGEVLARDSFITRWCAVPAGPLHLARRTADGLVSTGRFTVPAGTRSLLAVVAAGPEGNNHTFKLIDPATKRFSKGTTLLINFSDKKALVALGKTQVTVDPQATVVARPVPEENGMCRLIAGYRNPDGQMIACYDRYVSTNPEAREFLFLLPDAHVGLKVLCLPEFGAID